LKLKWTKHALRQLILTQDYIARDDPKAAHAVAQRIAKASRLLPAQQWIGRTGRVEGTREWVVKQTPYLLVYALEDDTVQIVGVIHSKQRWPETFLR
jgi:addiction module RelE/StbE family toxin